MAGGLAQIRTEIPVFVRDGLYPFELQGRVVLPAGLEPATIPCERTALSCLSYGSTIFKYFNSCLRFLNLPLLELPAYTLPNRGGSEGGLFRLLSHNRSGRKG